MGKSILSVLIAPLALALGFGILEAVYFTVRETLWFLFEIAGALLGVCSTGSLMIVGAAAGLPAPYGRPWLFVAGFVIGALSMVGIEAYFGFFDYFVDGDPGLWAFFFGGLCLGPMFESFAADRFRWPPVPGIRLSAIGAAIGMAGFAAIAWHLNLPAARSNPHLNQLLVFVLVHTAVCVWMRSPAGLTQGQVKRQKMAD